MRPICSLLGVEGLGGSHAHFDVATVRRVEDTVGLGCEIAVAAIHDGQHVGAAGAHQVDGSVGVGRRPRLTDRHDERVAHVVD